MSHVYDMIVIGGGPAGYTSALYAVRAGLSCAVIEKMSVGGQLTLTDTVDNYPGFDEGIDAITLGMKMQAGAERFGAESIYDEVIGLFLDAKEKKVICSGGEYKARTVVVATGASPRPLGIDREQELVGRGVHYCAHCDGRFYKGKRVIVVGGGNSAVGDALYLSKLAERVILVHRRDTLRASKIYNEPLENAHNIELCYDTVVSDIITDEMGKVKGAKTKSTKDGREGSIDADGIFVSIGRLPATELVRGVLQLDPSGYITADESTKTNIDGVYAAGDVRTKSLRQIVTAVSDGAVAAHHAEEYISGV